MTDEDALTIRSMARFRATEDLVRIYRDGGLDRWVARGTVRATYCADALPARLALFDMLWPEESCESSWPGPAGRTP